MPLRIAGASLAPFTFRGALKHLVAGTKPPFRPFIVWGSLAPNNSFKPNPLRGFGITAGSGASAHSHRRGAGRLNSGVRHLMQDSWLSNLTNLEVLAVESWPGCACVIRLSGDYQLKVDTLWRLRQEGNITLTSHDNGQVYGDSIAIEAIPRLSATLSGKSIVQGAVAAGSGDLTLDFGGLTLEILTTLSGYEAWELEGPGNLCVVALPGGDLAVWDQGA